MSWKSGLEFLEHYKDDVSGLSPRLIEAAFRAALSGVRKLEREVENCREVNAQLIEIQNARLALADELAGAVDGFRCTSAMADARDWEAATERCYAALRAYRAAEEGEWDG